MRKLKACVQFTLGILNALGIDDNETRFLLSSLFSSRFTNLIFLKPVRAGLVLHPHEVHSIAENKNERFSILENPWDHAPLATTFEQIEHCTEYIV